MSATETISQVNTDRFNVAISQDPVIQDALKSDQLHPDFATFEAGVILAQTLVNKGVAQLEEHVIKGETENVTQIVRGLLTRATGNVVAGYGSNKTTLFPNIPNLVEGLDRFSTVENREDVTSSEITGRSQRIVTREQVTDEQGIESERVTSAEAALDAMVSPDTQYLFVDEATRKRQKALATLLDITAKSRVHTKDGWRNMEDYEGGVFAANPNERGMTTERLLPALADRMQYGVILAREGDWDGMLDAVIDDEFEPTPEEMAPVMTLAKLHVAQYALREIVVDPGIKLFIKEISKTAARTFRDPIVDGSGDMVMPAHIMSPVRFARHLMQNSMASAISRGSLKAEMRDVQDGLSTKTHGLMTANGVSFEEPIHEIADRILDTAKGNVKIAIDARKSMVASQQANTASNLRSVK